MKKFFPGVIIAIIISFFIFSGSVHADEADPDLVQDETVSEPVPEVIADLPVTEATSEIYIPVSNNIAVSAAVHDFKTFLFDSSVEFGNPITFNDDFDLIVSDYFDIILIQKGDPEFFKSIFISLILDSLGITPDSPLYDYFYDIIADYYDDMTGITQQRENNALGTLCFCALGSISLLGFVKWVI